MGEVKICGNVKVQDFTVTVIVNCYILANHGVLLEFDCRNIKFKWPDDLCNIRA